MLRRIISEIQALWSFWWHRRVWEETVHVQDLNLVLLRGMREELRLTIEYLERPR